MYALFPAFVSSLFLFYGVYVVTTRGRTRASLAFLGMTTLTWDRHEGHARSYDVVTHGFNYRLDDLRAALGRAQLAKLHQGNERRRALAGRYRRLLRDSDRFVPVRAHDDHSAHHLMAVVARDARTREVAATALQRARVQSSLHYPCITDFAAFAAYADADVPLSREYAARTLTLPLHPGLEPSEVDDIAQGLFNRFYAGDAAVHVTAEAAQTYLGDLRALFILDRLPLNGDELAELADLLAASAVLIAADGAAPDTLLELPIGGLPRGEAIALCAAEARLARRTWPV